MGPITPADRALALQGQLSWGHVHESGHRRQIIAHQTVALYCSPGRSRTSGGIHRSAPNGLTGQGLSTAMGEQIVVLARDHIRWTGQEKDKSIRGLLATFYRPCSDSKPAIVLGRKILDH